MGMGLRLAHTLKSVWAGQHFTPLLGHRGATTSGLLLLRHADRKHLRGFLPGGRAAEGGQAQREALGILALAHPVLLGHPEKGFDRIGADGQTDVVEPKHRGRLELVLERVRTLAAHRGGRHRVDKRLARCQRVVTEAPGFEHLLACQQRDRIVSEGRAQGLARGSGIAAGAPLRAGGPCLGAAGWREGEQPIGPGNQPGSIHKPGFGVDGGGREAGQNGGLELTRDAAHADPQVEPLG